MIRRLTLGLLMLLPAAPALAQSAFGCDRLEEATPTPYVEGLDGVFFRLNLDFRLRHTVTEGSIELMSRLSQALAARGTTLIYVPVPSKGLAMPGSLPEQAAAYGFDHGIAVGIYEDTVARLREVGVVTIDALTPLLNLEDGQLAFIPADHHWSSAGSRAVAAEVGRAIAETPGYGDLEKVTTQTTSLGPQDIPSPVRREIQAMCRDTIPPSTTEAFETEVTAPAASGGGGIFAAEEGGPAIALVGTSMSRTPAFNFEGFLAEAAQLDVVNYAVIGGNQYGAIVSYLMSDEFLSAPPKYLVWENPIYNNLGEFGELPMRELVAAAIDDCTPLDVQRPDGRTLLAEVPGGELPADVYVRADAGTTRGRAIEIGFGTAEGLHIAASIERTQRLEPTRLFYQYMEPFWEPGISSVEVQFDRAVSGDASLAICKDQETAS